MPDATLFDQPEQGERTMGQALAKQDEMHSGQIVVTDAAALMEVIAKAAKDPQTDVEKLERLMGLYERITDRQARVAYSDAMTACQAEMRPISQDMSNSQTRSKYASLGQLDRAIRPIYTKHGFNVSFTTAKPDVPEHIKVVAKVSHRAGHSEFPELELPADGKGAKGGDVMTKTHAAMSAVSYGRRGLHKMIWNLAEGEHDDDGNAAGGGFITEAQAKTLDALIIETKADLRKFLEYVGAAAIYEIPAKKFDQAKRMLEEKKAKGANHARA